MKVLGKNALILLLYLALSIQSAAQKQGKPAKKKLAEAPKKQLSQITDSVVRIGRDPPAHTKKVPKQKTESKRQKRKLRIKLQQKKKRTHNQFMNKIGMLNHDLRRLMMPGGGGGGSVVVAPNQGSGIVNAQVVVNSLGTPASEPYANGKVIKGYDPADAEPRVIVTRMKLPTRGRRLKI